jgi:hypothetical protein
MISRFFGWVFFFVAAALFVRDGLAWRDSQAFQPETFNALWSDLSAATLGMFRADVLHTMPWLWNYLLAPALSLWAAPGLLFLSLSLFLARRIGQRRQHKATLGGATRRPS